MADSHSSSKLLHNVASLGIEPQSVCPEAMTLLHLFAAGSGGAGLDDAAWRGDPRSSASPQSSVSQYCRSVLTVYEALSRQRDLHFSSALVFYESVCATLQIRLNHKVRQACAATDKSGALTQDELVVLAGGIARGGGISPPPPPLSSDVNGEDEKHSVASSGAVSLPLLDPQAAVLDLSGEYLGPNGLLAFIVTMPLLRRLKRLDISRVQMDSLLLCLLCHAVQTAVSRWTSLCVAKRRVDRRQQEEERKPAGPLVEASSHPQEALLPMMANPFAALEELILDGNPFADVGADCVTQLARRWRRLRRVSVQDVAITGLCRKKLEAAVRQNDEAACRASAPAVVPQS